MAAWPRPASNSSPGNYMHYEFNLVSAGIDPRLQLARTGLAVPGTSPRARCTGSVARLSIVGHLLIRGDLHQHPIPAEAVGVAGFEPAVSSSRTTQTFE
jgi:hypothetical protein